MMMRHLFLCLSFVAFLFLISGCASDENVPRTDTNSRQQNTSAIPWNRPESWEGSSGYGGMVNQPGR